jgi:hypothetical protein
MQSNALLAWQRFYDAKSGHYNTAARSTVTCPAISVWWREQSASSLASDSSPVTDQQWQYTTRHPKPTEEEAPGTAPGAPSLKLLAAARLRKFNLEEVDLTDETLSIFSITRLHHDILHLPCLS